MGNVSMEARDINYRGGETKMSVEEALKSTSGEAAAIAQLQTDVGNLQTTKANLITIAPVFSAETAYDPGDLVYYNGLTYRCTNAHEGEWDADDFAATTIENELAELKSGLTNVGNYSASEVNTGMKWIDGRDIFRKVISCGVLPDTSQKIESSGLSNVTIIDIHGVAFSVSDAIPLPHAMSANKNAQLHYSNTIGSVVITTADDYSSYTNSYVYLLYVKNA